jgi:hypothetical protein
MDRLVAAAVLVGSLFASGAVTAAPPESASAASSSEVHEALAAQAAGLVEVRFIPNDSRSAQIIVTNRSDKPLSIRLPAVFAGVPVLAQMGGGGNQAGFGAGGIGAAPQSVGGGVQNAGMGIGGQGGGGGAFCWVAREVYGPHDPRWTQFRSWLTAEAPRWLHDLYAAHGEGFADWLHDKPVAKWCVRQVMDQAIAGEPSAAPVPQFQVGQAGGRTGDTVPFRLPAGKTRTFRVTTVCLEHGKAEPSSRRPYKLVSLETFSADPRLQSVLSGLGNGQVSQKVAQAVAWHVANGLTWDRLAAEKIDHAGGDQDEPFFAAAELMAAKRVVDALPAAKPAGSEASSASAGDAPVSAR